MRSHWLRAQHLLAGWAVLVGTAAAAPVAAQGDLRVSRIVVTPDYVVPRGMFTVRVWVRNLADTPSPDFDAGITVKQAPESVGAREQFYFKNDGTAQRFAGLRAREERLIHARADWRVEGSGDCTVVVWLKPVDGTAVQESHRFTLPPAAPLESYRISTDRTGGLEQPQILVSPEAPNPNAPFSIRVWMRNRGARPWGGFSMIVRVRRMTQRPGEREEWYAKEQRPIRYQAIPGATAALMYARGDWAVNDPGVHEVVVTMLRENSEDLLYTRRFVVR